MFEVPRRGVHQFHQVGVAANAIENRARRERPGQGDFVERLVGVGEIRQDLVDDPVLGQVEVAGRQLVGNLVPRKFIEHQPAEHGLFRLVGVGRYPEAGRGSGNRYGFCHRSSNPWSRPQQGSASRHPASIQ